MWDSRRPIHRHTKGLETPLHLEPFLPVVVQVGCYSRRRHVWWPFVVIIVVRSVHVVVVVPIQ
jgi:hypothetical protein